ncbi:DUF1254 domain-containing protein [Nocardia sp. NPDC050713]|uniref:DUF1254 domain-containing protein n=1 Tax=Nocardia sp. NPDC050713 TaxID=3154511 RepID=UPI0033D24B6B
MSERDDVVSSSGARRVITRRTMLGWATTAAIGLAACGRSDDEGAAATDETADIANEAFVFGYPLMLMHEMRTAALASTPVDHFQHDDSLPTPDRRDVVRLNLDTLYSSAWLDLSKGPVALRVPAMNPDRYWLMTVTDTWSNTVHNPSSVRPGVRPGVTAPPFDYVITGPSWSGALPEGLTPLPMPTPTVWLLSRIEVDGAADISAAQAIQRGLRLVSLDDWVAGRAAPAEPTRRPKSSQPPAERVADMGAGHYYERLCELMETDPPAPADEPAMARFAEIGIEPGGRVRGVSDATLTAAATEAKRSIAVYIDPDTRMDNGWTYDPEFGAYGTEYLHRAASAYQGLGANLAEDTIYPTYYGNADTYGTPNRFRLRFPAGQTPPVDAFWSLTTYGPDGFLVANPAGIYAVGHQVPVVPGPDGSVELAIQHADPGPAVPQGNWLPIPAEGEFELEMRLYAPRPEAIDGRWKPPPVTRAR